jgi:hypothetical protein
MRLFHEKGIPSMINNIRYSSRLILGSFWQKNPCKIIRIMQKKQKSNVYLELVDILRKKDNISCSFLW